MDPLTGFLVSRISDQLAAKAPEQYYSIALSGGSTPKGIFNLIAEKYQGRINWSRVTFFWGDERCVPPTDPVSNYRMTHENLLKPLTIPESNYFRIHGEDDPVAEAGRYSEKVKAMLPAANNLPQFDMILLGLGDDGHTASIFPYNISLLRSDKLFETSEHPVSRQMRITATGKLINNAKEVCFLVTGSGKAARVTQILQKKEGWEKLPASHIKPTYGRVIWLLDKEAGAGLLI